MKFCTSTSARTGSRRVSEPGTLGKPDIAVEYRLLRTSDEAGAVWFAGSPTILIDGADAFPSDGRTSELACRLYYTDAGISRLPTVEQLTRVFQEHLI